MALVKGVLTDFGLDPMADASPLLVFRPGTGGVSRMNVLASKDVEVSPAKNGYFEAELVETDRVAPAMHYTIEIRWIQRGGSNKVRRSVVLPWKLYVPAGGGFLADLLRIPANPALVFTGPTPPANPTPGSWWQEPATGDLKEYDGTGWNFKANLRGPAGYMATGAAEDIRALAQYARATAGPNEFAKALTDVVETAVDEVRAGPIRRAQFEAHGAATMATAAGRARTRYEDTRENYEGWWDLLSTAGHNGVTTENNRLVTPATGATPPTGAKLAWTPGAYGIARSVLDYVPGDNAAFFGVAGKDPAPRASSSDALMIGVRAPGTPGRVRGTDVGGTGQADLDAAALPKGRYLATIMVTPSHISLTLKSLATLQEWGHTYPRDYLDPVGGIGHILLYAPWRTGGGLTGWEPVTWSAEPTTGKEDTIGGRKVRGEAPTVAYIGPADYASDRWRIQLPANHDPRVPTPLVLWLHNNSGTATNGATDARMKPLMDALNRAGYLVASADASGSAWGNDTSRAQYRALNDFMRARYAVSSVVLLGVSMGGQVALNLLPRLEIPNVAAYVGVGAVASLDDLWRNYAPSIKDAFKLNAEGTDYETKTAGYRPEDRAGHEFRGVPMMFVHSPDDATCDIAATRALAAKVAPYSPEAVVVPSTGAHLAAPQFQDAITHALPFLQRYAPTT